MSARRFGGAFERCAGGACAMLALALGGAGLGCRSPEASRTRGGGPGADPQNRGEGVTLHEERDPYRGTPLTGAGR